MNTRTHIRAAIVGLGRWGQNLVAANAQHPDSALRFTRAATRTPAKVAAFCKQYGLDPVADYGEVLRDGDVDAVVLATPHSQHADQIRAAAAAGKHVFVEKPMALTLGDGASAAAACKAAGVVLCVGFNRRFLPGYRALRAVADVGDLGRLMHVEGSFCGGFGYQYTNEMWRGTASENPAGGMAAMGIHILDAMIGAMGPVARAATLSRRLAVEADIDDTTSVLLDFASGATGSLSTLMATGSFWRLHLFGSAGWAQMPNQRSLTLCDASGNCSNRMFDEEDTLALELAAFGATILSEKPYPVSTAEALMGVATMQAISASAAGGGAWVNVEVPPPI